MKRLVLLAAAALLSLTACAKEKLKAPEGHRVCFYIAQTADGTIRNNPVAQNVPNIEQCAAELERMRIRFLRMGGTTQEMLGAYQGTFIFVTRSGIYTAQRFEGVRYLLLVRANGKLVMPGAVVEAPQTSEPQAEQK